jgi:hypothetical protein
MDGCVRTAILGRPDLYPRTDAPPAPRTVRPAGYTFNWEEPD